MPFAPRKPCAEGGCGKLVPSGTARCAPHAKAYQDRRNAARGGSGWSWGETRKRILARDGGCVMEAPHEGPLIVDHVVPLERGGTNADSNLHTLCRDRHHKAKTAREASERAARR